MKQITLVELGQNYVIHLQHFQDLVASIKALISAGNVPSLSAREEGTDSISLRFLGRRWDIRHNYSISGDGLGRGLLALYGELDSGGQMHHYHTLEISVEGKISIPNQRPVQAEEGAEAVLMALVRQ